ncbi:class II fructose-bisphosphate aldolase [Succinatimonas hippei]|uniref:class II fructose-bisphosphate aldolase n=1 Tax=Succinatimonas hippei TaxID=626938 RepID=UPI0026F23D25|nr:class II fructose-bisphosphate aldolase [Succinatimonas hippei]
MLCPFKRLLLDALKDRRAVGAFNVGNLEMLLGIVKAAEESNTPVILQIAEKRFSHSPLEYIAPMLHAAAMRAKVEIALELDHGCTLFNVRRSMDLGFNTIMFDGSMFHVDKNIEETKKIADEAHARGVALEAEIGVVGGAEGGAEMQANCASLSDIIKLGTQSSCDALAVAIGNAHGHYKGVPKLNFKLLEDAHNALPDLPLVLHGGTGISLSDFRKAITMGIAKINIATANFDAIVTASQKYTKTSDPKSSNYFSLNELMVEEVYNTTLAHIKVFNNQEPLESINF